ncbi:nucleotide-binding protein [Thiovibrio sp. JS02]
MPGIKELQPEIIAAFHRKNFATPVIGVTGGKGGVGKTAVAVNLACALADSGRKVALIDADVDAPNAALLLDLPLVNHEPVPVTMPEINRERCTGCGACVEVCRRNALFLPRGGTPILLGQCNGCEACFLVCPEEAFARRERIIGHTHRAEGAGLTLFTGELTPTAEESAEVVKAVKSRAFKEADDFDFLIVDTSPGTHCNVIFALAGADLVLAVTEPSPLGAHDLELILSLLDIFDIPGRVIVNRLESAEEAESVADIAGNHAAPVRAVIPLDENLAQSYVAATPLVRMNPACPCAGILFGLARAVAEEFSP